MSDSSDPFALQRFISAQEEVYEHVLKELQHGQKRSHWMWYIFPQMDGLGVSAMSRFYAIKSIDEARAYLQHPILGKRLIECSRTVWLIKNRSVREIFGSPDDMKFKSCMTLFEIVAPSNSIFTKLLEDLFSNERDNKTVQLIKNE